MAKSLKFAALIIALVGAGTPRQSRGGDFEQPAGCGELVRHQITGADAAKIRYQPPVPTTLDIERDAQGKIDTITVTQTGTVRRSGYLLELTLLLEDVLKGETPSRAKVNVIQNVEPEGEIEVHGIRVEPSAVFNGFTLSLTTTQSVTHVRKGQSYYPLSARHSRALAAFSGGVTVGGKIGVVSGKYGAVFLDEHWVGIDPDLRMDGPTRP